MLLQRLAARVAHHIEVVDVRSPLGHHGQGQVGDAGQFGIVLRRDLPTLMRPCIQVAQLHAQQRGLQLV